MKNIGVGEVAGVCATLIVLFMVWAAAASIWMDRPPVTYDEQLGRYRSARRIKRRVR